jgi:hypothetical protein
MMVVAVGAAGLLLPSLVHTPGADQTLSPSLAVGLGSPSQVPSDAPPTDSWAAPSGSPLPVASAIDSAGNGGVVIPYNGWAKDVVVKYPENMKANEAQSVVVSNLGSKGECDMNVSYPSMDVIQAIPGNVGEHTQLGVWQGDFEIPEIFSGALTIELSCWQDGYHQGSERSWGQRQLSVAPADPWILNVSAPTNLTAILDVTPLELTISAVDLVGGVMINCSLAVTLPGQATRALEPWYPYKSVYMETGWSKAYEFDVAPPYTYGTASWLLTCIDEEGVTESASGTFDIEPIYYLVSPTPGQTPTPGATPPPDQTSIEP